MAVEKKCSTSLRIFERRVCGDDREVLVLFHPPRRHRGSSRVRYASASTRTTSNSIPISRQDLNQTWKVNNRVHVELMEASRTSLRPHRSLPLRSQNQGQDGDQSCSLTGPKEPVGPADVFRGQVSDRVTFPVDGGLSSPFRE